MLFIVICDSALAQKQRELIGNAYVSKLVEPHHKL
jgi:hypothetical protein